MCGRYAITLPPGAYRDYFGYEDEPDFPPRYNIAPSQPVPVVCHEGGTRRFRLMRWGFIPSWVKDLSAYPLVFNARIESVMEKASFRNAIRRRRCVFLADGFFEWSGEGKSRQPHFMRRSGGGPLPFAGIWETYADPSGGEIDTATIVTTQANAVLRPIHHRMPVILAPSEIETWLNAQKCSAEAVVQMASHPSSDVSLEIVPVGPRVNSAANDDIELLTPVAKPKIVETIPFQGTLF